MLKRAFFPVSLGSRSRRDRYRIVVGVARRAVAVAQRIAASAKQPFKAQVTEAVGINMPGDVFNADFIGNWIEMKQKEYDALRLRPHPYEFQMYYDV